VPRWRWPVLAAAGEVALQGAPRALHTPPFKHTRAQVEAYFANKGILGTGSDINFYWIGVTRQPNPDKLTSNIADQARWYTLPGTYLPMFAPSNHPDEAPMYAPYAHWSPYVFYTGRMWGGTQGDCVMANIAWG
jgi:hypothetical protein